MLKYLLMNNVDHIHVMVKLSVTKQVIDMFIDEVKALKEQDIRASDQQ